MSSITMSEERFDALLSSAAKSVPQVTLPRQEKSSSQQAVDILFKGLIGACVAGIGWMVVTLPVMKTQLNLLTADVESSTANRFTSTDFLREKSVLLDAIDRNTIAIDINRQALNSRMDFMADTKADIRELQKEVGIK